MTRFQTDATDTESHADPDGNGDALHLIEQGQQVLESMVQKPADDDATGPSDESAAPIEATRIEISEEDHAEVHDWIESLEEVTHRAGPEHAARILSRVFGHAQQLGINLPYSANTPYINTIPAVAQPAFPGNRELERRIKSIIRWNAMAMVVRANKQFPGIGGHISTYASVATLFEIGFNHFFRAKTEEFNGDQIFFQGHASPGIYSRAFLEGTLSVEHLKNFRREVSAGGEGLSSYPHPWLMPEFWNFPTVSMGLSPLTSIYQARFNRYLEHRGLAKTGDCRVYAFLGDGEMDEPEALGAITLASREGLDNLTWFVNCNLQRLDGPVRGNGKIIQELEAAFRGAGWNCIKVIWGSEWDSLLEADADGLLVQRMGEVVDGQYQKYTVEPGSYIRQHFFGTDPRLLKLVEHLSDEQLTKLKRGGHDPLKVYSAYKAATECKGRPTVILAKTIKGYGMGEAGEGRNVSHQQKKLNEKELKDFRDRFAIPISDRQISAMPFYRPDPGSPELEYLLERRRALGGFVPRRTAGVVNIKPADGLFDEFAEGSGGREASTTMVFVRMLAKLLKDSKLGKLIVPIVPDEARTFGMESMFRGYGIYSSKGQLYEPVDSNTLLYYREAKDGQILEEGITEAGSMASFTAAGTSYATHDVPCIPFFIFYSMFGFQRIGDSIWAAADMRCKGFLLGATAGRTTLNGEGLQHQDGHTHLIAATVPNCVTYDPAFACELSVIIQDGIRRMYQNDESIFYYITLYNENYDQPPMVEGSRDNILKGLYKFRPAADAEGKPRVHLFGSGTILREVLRAQQILAEKFGVAADVWSATSYKQLHRDGILAERWNLMHPAEEPRKPYVAAALEAEPWPIVAATDYVKMVPGSIARWTPDGIRVLGTDGFGRSDTREGLREFFEINGEFVALAALYELSRRGQYDPERVQAAITELGIDPEKPNPLFS